MTKDETKNEVKRAWPLVYVSEISWVQKGAHLYDEECANALDIHSYQTGVKSHRRWSAQSRRDEETWDPGHNFICEKCGKNLTMPKPNPYTIPDVPSRDDVKTSIHLTRALDDVFCEAYRYAMNNGLRPKDASSYPSFYSSYNEVLTLTWANIQEMLDVFTSWKMSGKMDKTDTRNLPRLEKLILETLQEAVIDASYKRDARIAEARALASLTEENKPSYNVTCTQDGSRNRGLFYVSAFDLSPQRDGESEWEFKYRTETRASYRQEIDVYVHVRNGECRIVFAQDIFDTVTNKEMRDVEDTSMDDAIQRATDFLWVQIDASWNTALQNAAIAREALDDAGLPYSATSIIGEVK